jgi:hypothetical protein
MSNTDFDRLSKQYVIYRGEVKLLASGLCLEKRIGFDADKHALWKTRVVEIRFVEYS